MAYYNICPYCRGHLDPGERCDCREKMERIQKIAERNRNAVRLDGKQYALKTEEITI